MGTSMATVVVASSTTAMMAMATSSAAAATTTATMAMSMGDSGGCKLSVRDLISVCGLI